MNDSGLRQVPTHPYPIENHLLQLIEWEDANGARRELKVYKRIAHKWKSLGILLGLEPGEIESIERNCRVDLDRVNKVLKQWIDNATNLPNARKYPKSWKGLCQLLDDAELGEVAKELRTAVSPERNDKNVVL